MYWAPTSDHPTFESPTFHSPTFESTVARAGRRHGGFTRHRPEMPVNGRKRQGLVGINEFCVEFRLTLPSTGNFAVYLEFRTFFTFIDGRCAVIEGCCR